MNTLIMRLLSKYASLIIYDKKLHNLGNQAEMFSEVKIPENFNRLNENNGKFLRYIKNYTGCLRNVVSK